LTPAPTEVTFLLLGGGKEGFLVTKLKQRTPRPKTRQRKDWALGEKRRQPNRRGVKGRLDRVTRAGKRRNTDTKPRGILEVMEKSHSLLWILRKKKKKKFFDEPRRKRKGKPTKVDDAIGGKGWRKKGRRLLGNTGRFQKKMYRELFSAEGQSVNVRA